MPNKNKKTDKIIINHGELRIALELQVVRKILEVERVNMVPTRNLKSEIRPGVITDKGSAIAVVTLDSLLSEDSNAPTDNSATVLILSEGERTLGLGLSKDLTGRDITVLRGDAFTITNPATIEGAFSRYSNGSFLQDNQSIELLNWRLLYDDTKNTINAG
jgi:chemotaxis signal transduction protein